MKWEDAPGLERRNAAERRTSVLQARSDDLPSYD